MNFKSQLEKIHNAMTEEVPEASDERAEALERAQDRIQEAIDELESE